MSSASAPPPPHALLSLRSPSAQFFLVLQSIARVVGYSRIAGGKSTIKIVEQARQDEPPVLEFGAIHILREMDTRVRIERSGQIALEIHCSVRCLTAA